MTQPIEWNPTADHASPTPPANPYDGELWYDTINKRLMGWNSGLLPGLGAWLPNGGTDPVIDEAYLWTVFPIPTSANSFAASVTVPGLQLDVPATGNDPIQIESSVPLTNGGTGWASGRQALASICDITDGSPGIEIFSLSTPATLSGSTHRLRETRSVTPPAGTRIYVVRAWINSNLLTNASVAAGGSINGLIIPARLRAVRE